MAILRPSGADLGLCIGAFLSRALDGGPKIIKSAEGKRVWGLGEFFLFLPPFRSGGLWWGGFEVSFGPVAQLNRAQTF